MTIEGWVIIGIGALMWWALVNRAQRIERVLTEIRDLLYDGRSDAKLAPSWPHPIAPSQHEPEGRAH